MSAYRSPNPGSANYSESLASYLTSLNLKMAMVMGSCKECDMNAMKNISVQYPNAPYLLVAFSLDFGFGHQEK